MSEGYVNAVKHLWSRLILPANSRHVESEDLNRNFWVISQLISGLAQYLYDDNSSLSQILKKLINEVVQLWENVLYLWTDYTVLTNKKDTSLRIIVLPLGNSLYECYNKYDNFGRDKIPTADDAEKQIDYLKDKFSEENLCVIPYVRLNNYQRNYYAQECYPYIFYYHRKDEKWTHQNIVINITTNEQITINPADFQDKLYAIYEDEGQYDYYFPLSVAENAKAKAQRRYYGTLRTIPEITAELQTDRIIVKKFDLKVYDAGREAILGKDNSPIIIKFVSTNSWDSTENDKKVTVTKTTGKVDTSNPQKTSTSINKSSFGSAFYMGEVASCYATTREIQPEKFRFRTVTIGNFVFAKDESEIKNKSYANNGQFQGGDAKYGLGSFTREYSELDNTSWKSNITARTKVCLAALDGGEGYDPIIKDGCGAAFSVPINSAVQLGGHFYTKAEQNWFQDSGENFKKLGQAFLERILLNKNNPTSKWNDQVNNYYNNSDHLKANNKLDLTDDVYFLTTVGLEPWLATSKNTAKDKKRNLPDVVWFKSLLCDVFRYDKNTDSIIHIGTVDRCEGYFTYDLYQAAGNAQTRSREYRFVLDEDSYIEGENIRGTLHFADQQTQEDKLKTIFRIEVNQGELTLSESVEQDGDSNVDITKLNIMDLSKPTPENGYVKPTEEQLSKLTGNNLMPKINFKAYRDVCKGHSKKVGSQRAGTVKDQPYQYL